MGNIILFCYIVPGNVVILCDAVINSSFLIFQMVQVNLQKEIKSGRQRRKKPEKDIHQLMICPWLLITCSLSWRKNLSLPNRIKIMQKQPNFVNKSGCSQIFALESSKVFVCMVLISFIHFSLVHYLFRTDIPDQQLKRIINNIPFFSKDPDDKGQTSVTFKFRHQVTK